MFARPGDQRVNQNPELFVVYVTFLQLHNLVAAELKNINPHWDSDDLFNEARKITTALYQNMIAKEYIRESIGKLWIIY